MSTARVWAPLWLCLLASAPAGAQIAVFATVDTAGDVGKHSSIAFGADGLPLIAYYDATNGDLKVAHCSTVDCTASTRAVIDSAGDVGSEPALAVGADGLAVVAYRDAVTGAVKVARCSELSCGSASIVTLSPGISSRGIAIAIGTDGLPLVAFARTGGLAVAHCTDVACSGATVAATGFSGLRPSIAIGADGLPILAFDTGFDLIVVRCANPACTAMNPNYVRRDGRPAPPPGVFGSRYSYYDASIVVGPDGRGVVVVTYEFQEYLPSPLPVRYTTFALRCASLECLSLDVSTIATGVFEPALALSQVGNPLVAQRTKQFNVGLQNYLSVARCLDPTCASVETSVIAGPGIGQNSSIAVGPDGIAMAAYYDEFQGDLGTAYLRGWGVVDLSLAISDAPEPALPGQVLRYEFRAANAGGTVATGLRLHAALPPGTVFLSSSFGDCLYAPAAHAVDCAPGSLPAGANAVLAQVEVRVPPAEPGVLTLSADIRATEVDFAPSNNTATAETTIGRWMAVEPAVVVEGDSGTTGASFQVVLHDTSPAGPPATVSFATGGGSATAGTDYLPATGVLTFPPGAPLQTVTVPVVGDTQLEGDESFGFQLSSPQGATVLVSDVTGTIVDDDVAALPLAGELLHATSRWGDLAAGASGPAGTRHYRIAQAPLASYEVVVDAVSGDVQPLELALLAGDGSTVLQTGAAPGTGASVRLGWTNTGSTPSLTQLVRVRSGGCRAGCAADDVYRIRAYDTTVRVPRFNNSGAQVTLLVLQNPSARPIGGRAWFWSASGAPAGSVSVSLASRETVVLNTATVAPGASGSISIGHDGGYGAVLGKAVALDPAAGLAFDTPLEARPR
jgi:uncharacterized repeat protein (TIGR01451 family)